MKESGIYKKCYKHSRVKSAATKIRRRNFWQRSRNYKEILHRARDLSRELEVYKMISTCKKPSTKD